MFPTCEACTGKCRIAVTNADITQLQRERIQREVREIQAMLVSGELTGKDLRDMAVLKSMLDRILVAGDPERIEEVSAAIAQTHAGAEN